MSVPPARPPRTIRHAAGSRLLAAALTVALVSTGCAADPPLDAAALDGLLVLAAQADGGASLSAWTLDATAEDGIARHDIGVPSPATAWISAGRASVLAATLIDGTLHTSDPLVPAGEPPAWREVPIEAANTGERPAWFATWDPSGRRFAALAGDLPGGGDLVLLLVDPTDRTAVEVPLDQPLLAAAPAWLDRDRVVVLGGSSTEPRAVIVDTVSGRSTDGPAGHRRLSTSADGAVIATSGGAGSGVAVRSTHAWLEGDESAIGTILAPSEAAVAASMALDRSGRRIAVVWLDESFVRIDVHDGRDGWRRIAGPPLDDASAAMVGWLR